MPGGKAIDIDETPTRKAGICCIVVNELIRKRPFRFDGNGHSTLRSGHADVLPGWWDWTIRPHGAGPNGCLEALSQGHPRACSDHSG